MVDSGRRRGRSGSASSACGLDVAPPSLGRTAAGTRLPLVADPHPPPAPARPEKHQPRVDPSINGERQRTVFPAARCWLPRPAARTPLFRRVRVSTPPPASPWSCHSRSGPWRYRWPRLTPSQASSRRRMAHTGWPSAVMKVCSQRLPSRVSTSSGRRPSSWTSRMVWPSSDATPRVIRGFSLQLPNWMAPGLSTRQLHSSISVTSPCVSTTLPRLRSMRVCVVSSPSSRNMAEPNPRHAWETGIPTSGRVSAWNCSRLRLVRPGVRVILALQPPPAPSATRCGRRGRESRRARRCQACGWTTPAVPPPS